MICYRCGMYRPFDEFAGYDVCARCRTVRDELSVLNARPGSYLGKVRAAVARVEAERAERERARARDRRGNKYDFGPERLKSLTAAQGNLCAICDTPPPEGQVLHLDHDHDTGEVRGLLCQSCNIGLGFFRDDVDLVDRAYNYLINPPAEEIS